MDLDALRNAFHWPSEPPAAALKGEVIRVQDLDGSVDHFLVMDARTDGQTVTYDVISGNAVSNPGIETTED